MLVGAAVSGVFFWLVALGLRRSVGTFSAYAIEPADSGGQASRTAGRVPVTRSTPWRLV